MQSNPSLNQHFCDAGTNPVGPFHVFNVTQKINVQTFYYYIIQALLISIHLPSMVLLVHLNNRALQDTYNHP